ncbi:MAG: hypothetical protein ABSB32_07060 [Thermodesulfobacteriota bacterium]
MEYLPKDQDCLLGFARSSSHLWKERWLSPDGLPSSRPSTGATVQECSRVLLKAGAKQVDLLTLARAI